MYRKYVLAECPKDAPNDEILRLEPWVRSSRSWAAAFVGPLYGKNSGKRVVKLGG